MTTNESPHYQAIIDSPIPGVPSLGIRLQGEQAVEIDFLFRHRKERVDVAAAEVVALLRDYLYRARDPGQVSALPFGTPFQQRIWHELSIIPFGETRSYGELATRLGSSARAVAGACRRNPLPLLIPCHRVVAKNGLGGFMGKLTGPAVAIKAWLLQHEGHV